MTPWEECIHSALIGWIIYRCQLSPIDWLWHSIRVHLYWFSSTSSLLDLSATERQIHLPQKSGFTCFSSSSISIYFMYLGIPLLCAHTFKTVMPSWRIGHFIVLWYFSLSLICIAIEPGLWSWFGLKFLRARCSYSSFLSTYFCLEWVTCGEHLLLFWLTM